MGEAGPVEMAAPMTAGAAALVARKRRRDGRFGFFGRAVPGWLEFSIITILPENSQFTIRSRIIFGRGRRVQRF
jgi:hypothetical protein